MQEELHLVAEEYGWKDIAGEPINIGLINNTWRVTCATEEFIIQRMNENVFPNVAAIDYNIRILHHFLIEQGIELAGLRIMFTPKGRSLVQLKSGYYRAFRFIPHQCVYQTVKSNQVAFEAAKRVGLFTASFQNFDASHLKITIPNFHDLAFRFQQYQVALSTKSPRIATCKQQMNQVERYLPLIDTFQVAFGSKQKRVIHHDVKISNLLFEGNNKAIALVDYDTVMPGYFISDIGDMMRTYLTPIDENSTNLDAIELKKERYQAIIDGYMETMGSSISKGGLKLMHFSGSYIIFMQALRFLTDYINGDQYYKTQYDLHNLDRAKNQLALLLQYQNLN